MRTRLVGGTRLSAANQGTHAGRATMDRRVWIGTAVASAMFLSVAVAAAADRDGPLQLTAADTQEQEQIYGSQLMTEQERAAYQAKMRAAKNTPSTSVNTNMSVDKPSTSSRVRSTSVANSSGCRSCDTASAPMRAPRAFSSGR